MVKAKLGVDSCGIGECSYQIVSERVYFMHFYMYAITGYMEFLNTALDINHSINCQLRGRVEVKLTFAKKPYHSSFIM